jgi:hypothetical protein
MYCWVMIYWFEVVVTSKGTYSWWLCFESDLDEEDDLLLEEDELRSSGFSFSD